MPVKESSSLLLLQLIADVDHDSIRRLPVINDKKRMVGMLSLGDVAKAASHELTGEIVAAVSAHHA